MADEEQQFSTRRVVVLPLQSKTIHHILWAQVGDEVQFDLCTADLHEVHAAIKAAGAAKTDGEANVMGDAKEGGEAEGESPELRLFVVGRYVASMDSAERIIASFLELRDSLVKRGKIKSDGGAS